MQNEAGAQAGAQAGAWGLPPSSWCLVFSRFCDIKHLGIFLHINNFYNAERHERRWTIAPASVSYYQVVIDTTGINIGTCN